MECSITANYLLRSCILGIIEANVPQLTEVAARKNF